MNVHQLTESMVFMINVKEDIL